jgi:hypothetical protein
VIKRLNNELEVEQMEKVELQEELRQQHEKTKKLGKFLELTAVNLFCHICFGSEESPKLI